LVFEKDISEVSREMGKVVGAALVEFALGKGVLAGLRALRGLPAATAFLKTANELKQTIGKLPVPTPGMKVVVNTMGNKMVFPDVELTKLEDIVKMMKSSDESLTMLKNGSMAGKEILTEVAEQGLSEKAQSGLKVCEDCCRRKERQKLKHNLSQSILPELN
jgi:hypothetical protein